MRHVCRVEGGGDYTTKLSYTMGREIWYVNTTPLHTHTHTNIGMGGGGNGRIIVIPRDTLLPPLPLSPCGTREGILCDKKYRSASRVQGVDSREPAPREWGVGECPEGSQ